MFRYIISKHSLAASGRSPVRSNMSAVGAPGSNSALRRQSVVNVHQPSSASADLASSGLPVTDVQDQSLVRSQAPPAPRTLSPRLPPVSRRHHRDPSIRSRPFSVVSSTSTPVVDPPVVRSAFSTDDKTPKKIENDKTSKKIALPATAFFPSSSGAAIADHRGMSSSGSASGPSPLSPGILSRHGVSSSSGRSSGSCSGAHVAALPLLPGREPRALSLKEAFDLVIAEEERKAAGNLARAKSPPKVSPVQPSSRSPLRPFALAGDVSLKDCYARVVELELRKKAAAANVKISSPPAKTKISLPSAKSEHRSIVAENADSSVRPAPASPPLVSAPRAPTPLVSRRRKLRAPPNSPASPPPVRPAPTSRPLVSAPQARAPLVSRPRELRAPQDSSPPVRPVPVTPPRVRKVRKATAPPVSPSQVSASLVCASRVTPPAHMSPSPVRRVARPRALASPPVRMVPASQPQVAPAAVSPVPVVPEVPPSHESPAPARGPYDSRAMVAEISPEHLPSPPLHWRPPKRVYKLFPTLEEIKAGAAARHEARIAGKPVPPFPTYREVTLSFFMKAPAHVVPKAPAPVAPNAPVPVVPKASASLVRKAPRPVVPKASVPVAPEPPAPVVPKAPARLVPEAPAPLAPKAPRTPRVQQPRASARRPQDPVQAQTPVFTPASVRTMHTRWSSPDTTELYPAHVTPPQDCKVKLWRDLAKLSLDEQIAGRAFTPPPPPKEPSPVPSERELSDCDLSDDLMDGSIPMYQLAAMIAKGRDGTPEPPSPPSTPSALCGGLTGYSLTPPRRWWKDEPTPPRKHPRKYMEDEPSFFTYDESGSISSQDFTIQSDCSLGFQGSRRRELEAQVRHYRKLLGMKSPPPQPASPPPRFPSPPPQNVIFCDEDGNSLDGLDAPLAPRSGPRPPRPGPVYCRNVPRALLEKGVRGLYAYAHGSLLSAVARCFGPGRRHSTTLPAVFFHVGEARYGRCCRRRGRRDRLCCSVDDVVNGGCDALVDLSSCAAGSHLCGFRYRLPFVSADQSRPPVLTVRSSRRLIVVLSTGPARLGVARLHVSYPPFPCVC